MRERGWRRGLRCGGSERGVPAQRRLHVHLLQAVLRQLHGNSRRKHEEIQIWCFEFQWKTVLGLKKKCPLFSSVDFEMSFPLVVATRRVSKSQFLEAMVFFYFPLFGLVSADIGGGGFWFLRHETRYLDSEFGRSMVQHQNHPHEKRALTGKVHPNLSAEKNLVYFTHKRQQNVPTDTPEILVKNCTICVGDYGCCSEVLPLCRVL